VKLGEIRLEAPGLKRIFKAFPFLEKIEYRIGLVTVRHNDVILKYLYGE
jgi:hypothetical protein